MQTIERPEWGHWVTPKLLWQRPIYRWYVYPHSYDKNLVLALLKYMEVQEDEWVWDPFVGAGTTLLACREYGCSAIGTDLLPLSVLVTRCKTHKYNSFRLAEQAKTFSFELPAGVTDRFAPIPVVEKAFTANRRRQISYLLDQINKLPRTSRPFFQIALLRSMEDLGLAVKGGGWLRIDPDRDVKGLSLRSLFYSYINAMLEDLAKEADCLSKSKSIIQISLADARTAKTSGGIAACITSPPYLNRHDYTRVFALELALTGVKSQSELVSLRHNTLRSHVEAKPPRHAKQNGAKIPSTVTGVIEAIEATGMNDRRISAMIKGYFEDMSLVMQNIAHNLRMEGRVALVIGNTRFSGIMIPVDEILMSMGPSVGLEPEQIVIARRRGNSAQQMGLYGREPSRESILILKKSKL